MAILPILHYPHATLTRSAQAVAQVDDSLRALAANMHETLIDAGGIGLAAPQVGGSIRLFITNVSEQHDAPLTYFNPILSDHQGEETRIEGCLSIPEIQAEIKRAYQVTVSAIDEDNKPFSFTATGLLAVCLQHELDHLNGVLFIDHLSRLKRARLLARYKKRQQHG